MSPTDFFRLYLHRAICEDLKQGIDTLLDLVGADSLCQKHNGIAIPHNRISATEWEALMAIKGEKRIGYVRKSIRNGHYGAWRKWCRKASRVLPFPALYRIAHANTLMGEDAGEGLVYSVPVMASTPPQCVVSLIDMAIKKQKHLVLQLHSVDDHSSANDPLCYPTQAFEALLSHIEKRQDENLLNVVTTMEMVRKLQNKRM